MFRNPKLNSELLINLRPKIQISFLGDSTIDNRIWVDGLIKSYIYSRLKIKRETVLQRIQQSHRWFFKSQLSVIENVIDMMPDHLVHDYTNDGFTTADCIDGAFRDKVFGRGTFSMFPHEFFEPLLEGAEAIKNSKYVVLSVGGNDVREFLQSTAFSSRHSIRENFLLVMERLRRNYLALLKKIRELNPDAHIILMTQYYPSAIQNNYKIYEKMQIIGEILDLGGASHEPMNVLHEIMKKTYADILKEISMSSFNNIFVVDVTSSLNPFDNNNHVSQIEPSVAGGKKIAGMLKYMMTSSKVKSGEAHRFYPEFFAANDEEKHQFVAATPFASVSFAHPFDLRDAYSLQEEKIYKEYKAEESDCETILNQLKTAFSRYATDSNIHQQGLAVWNEANTLLRAGISESERKKFKMSLILAIHVLGHPHDDEAVRLLEKNAAERAIGKSDAGSQYKAALAMLSGGIIIAATAVTFPLSASAGILGGVGGLLTGLGARFFYRNRPQQLAKANADLAQQQLDSEFLFQPPEQKRP